MAEAKRLRALVVDDEEVVREFLVRVLSLKGFETAAAEDGMKAIALARQGPFDICFLDVRMPRLNGLETMRELKKINPSAAYIMMTGYAVDDILRQAAAEGAAASIKKPFNISELETLIKEYAGRGALPARPLRLLVVDDEEVVLNFFKRLLKDCEITTASSGADALAIAQEKDFDLLFLDILLDDMNGIELYEKIKKVQPGIEAILITGDPAQAHIEGLDIKGCFYKPFEINQILAEIAKVKCLKGLS